ncbi:MAG: hypothetical protein A2Y33_07015 [Spirochaetes bacterium GWF1_51_8]|nr:MAG: hypothetical protein A2Y33_07015 [Spirochaetes bacterium GWF1_51_8]
MRILADENIDAQLVLELRNLGEDVVFIAELNPGIKDQEVFDIASVEKRILLTSDKDFGEIVFRQKKITEGVILLRLSGLSISNKISKLLTLIKDHKPEIPHSFSVVTKNNIRIRRR